MNAITHGVLARDVVLPNEDEEEFRSFKVGFERDLQPVGELEEFLVGQIATYAWRLLRAMRVEKGVFVRYVFGHIANEARMEAYEVLSGGEAFEDEHGLNKFRQDLRDILGESAPEQLAQQLAKLDRWEAAKAAEAAALERAKEAEAIRNQPDAVLGQAFQTDAEEADVFSKLSRYETQLQRSMSRTLDELRRLQAARNKTETADQS